MLATKEKPPVNPEGVSGLNKNLKRNSKNNNTTNTTFVEDIFDSSFINNEPEDGNEDVREPQQLIPIEPFLASCPWLLLHLDRLCTEETCV